MKSERCKLKKIKKITKIIVIFISLNFLMGFYYDNSIINKTNKIIVEIGNIISEEEIKNMIPLTNGNNIKLENNVPKNNLGETTKVGKYNYYIVYVDKERKISKIISQSEIEIIDTVKPVIVLKENEYTFNYGATININDIAKCIDLSECTLSFDKSIDTTKSGIQEVKIIAIDEGNNQTEETIKIKILDKPQKNPVFNNYYNYGSIKNMNDNNNLINSKLSYNDKINLRNELIEYAKKFLGYPYVYGGNSLTNGTDCSGFTKLIYANYNYLLPRSSYSQAYIGYQINENEILPGDLVVYHYSGRIGGHVGIYIGDGKMIHAGTSKTGIAISPLLNEYKTFRRIIL